MPHIILRIKDDILVVSNLAQLWVLVFEHKSVGCCSYLEIKTLQQKMHGTGYGFYFYNPQSQFSRILGTINYFADTSCYNCKFEIYKTGCHVSQSTPPLPSPSPNSFFKKTHLLEEKNFLLAYIDLKPIFKLYFSRTEDVI